MEHYNPLKTEKKWQKRWEEQKIYSTDLSDAKNKFYSLVMLPYPSSDKLHIGHWYSYAPADSYTRFMRMKGFNVFEPMGFDSFGLPAENYAIKTGAPPHETTENNIEVMRMQLKAMGNMYDWDKEMVASRPDYYRWTQWIFLQLYKKGLAYKKKAPVNWCASCQTVLANEQVKDGLCERCDTVIVQKDLSQWFFSIKDYAEDLLNHGEIDWPENTVLMQKNWIGRSEGITWTQRVKDLGFKVEAYDSVPQTFGAQTYAVIAPEHPLIPELVKGTKHEKPVMEFIEKLRAKKVANKFNLEKEMEGIFTGRYIDNPFGTGDLPIWIASFVVMDYGSGIVNCSAHDERDFEFAKKYDIPLRPVMFPKDPEKAKKVRNLEFCYHHAVDGILQYPAEFKGRKWGEAREDIIDYCVKKGFGRRTVNFKLRDWLISRQRYWGAPIPVVNCQKCGEVPVPEKDLPVLLPEKGVDYKPKGKSPLASVPDFVKTKCPSCGGAAEREVDTMDTFVCSSWYYLRYLSPGNSKEAFDMKTVKKWMPIDLYIGGPEHACMHLLYARFIYKVLMNDKKAEPFKKLVHQGLITKDGAKMSKSRGNVVSPDDFVGKYGSDVFRMYLMFMGPFSEGGDWSDRGITGIVRFLDRAWAFVGRDAMKKDDSAVVTKLHETIKGVTEDLERFQFNTCLAKLMEFLNTASKRDISAVSQKTFVQLLAPFAPHFAEEAWEVLSADDSVFSTKWPRHDEKKMQRSMVPFVVQVNGKVRGTLLLPADSSEKEILAAAREEPNAVKHMKGKELLKQIYVPGKLVNFVVNRDDN